LNVSFLRCTFPPPYVLDAGCFSPNPPTFFPPRTVPHPPATPQKRFFPSQYYPPQGNAKPPLPHSWVDGRRHDLHPPKRTFSSFAFLWPVSNIESSYFLLPSVGLCFHKNNRLLPFSPNPQPLFNSSITKQPFFCPRCLKLHKDGRFFFSPPRAPVVFRNFGFRSVSHQFVWASPPPTSARFCSLSLETLDFSVSPPPILVLLVQFRLLPEPSASCEIFP